MLKPFIDQELDSFTFKICALGTSVSDIRLGIMKKKKKKATI